MDENDEISMLSKLLGVKLLDKKAVAIWSVLCLLESSKIITINPDIYDKNTKEETK